MRERSSMPLRPRTLLTAAAFALALAWAAGLEPSPAGAQFKEVALSAAPSGPAVSANGDSQLTDDQLLRSAGLTPEEPALVGFFRARTRPGADRARVAGLIDKLGAKQVAEREQALGELVALGAPAVPQLRQATRDPDSPQA